MPHSHDVLGLLHRHRSIRAFTSEPVSDEHLAAAVRAGQMASTSSAVQAYCVLNVRDSTVRREFARLAGEQEKVASCGTFLLVCGDTRRHRLAAERDLKPHRANLESFLLAVIDAALFAQNLVVALESMKYGICYIGGIRNDLRSVDELLALPEGVYPLFGLCAGRAAETPSERPRLPLDAVLFDERYPDDATLLAAIQRYDDSYRRYLTGRGASGSAWSERMAEKFATTERDALREYYESKGARW